MSKVVKSEPLRPDSGQQVICGSRSQGCQNHRSVDISSVPGFNPALSNMREVKDDIIADHGRGKERAQTASSLMRALGASHQR